MKWLSTYKLFESTKLNEIEQDLIDMSLDIQDNNGHIQILKHDQSYLLCLWLKSNDSTKLIDEFIFRSIDYMRKFGYTYRLFSPGNIYEVFIINYKFFINIEGKGLFPHQLSNHSATSYVNLYFFKNQIYKTKSARDIEELFGNGNSDVLYKTF